MGDQPQGAAVLGRDLFILQVHLFTFAKVGQGGQIVVAERQVQRRTCRGRVQPGDHHAVRHGGDRTAQPGAVFVRIAHAHLTGGVIGVAHIILGMRLGLRHP